MGEFLNITQSAYSRLESGSTEPTLMQVCKIAEKIDVSVLQLLSFTSFIQNKVGSFSNNNDIENKQISNNSTIYKLEEINIQISEYLNQVNS